MECQIMGEIITNSTKIFLGITGLSGSGKDTFADMLVSIVTQNGNKVHCLKLSDEIHEGLLKMGIKETEIDRQVLIDEGNRLRTTFGGGILAHQVIKRAQTSKSLIDSVVLVFTGIRNPEEVRVFRERLREKFILIGIESDASTRQERKAARRQYSDDNLVSRVLELADENIGIRQCIEKADVKIENNGDKQSLKEAALMFYMTHIARNKNK
jgi:dephospho-CoA kinase